MVEDWGCIMITVCLKLAIPLLQSFGITSPYFPGTLDLLYPRITLAL